MRQKRQHRENGSHLFRRANTARTPYTHQVIIITEILSTGQDSTNRKNAENNARYIAAFNPEVVQALLDELESAKKRIAELESSTVKAVSKKSQGWARPLMAKKHHYFAEGEVTSICGGWMYFGNEREPDTFESPDDCKKCRRKLNKGGSK